MVEYMSFYNNKKYKPNLFTKAYFINNMAVKL